MRKIIYSLGIVFLMVSCKNEGPKNYVSLSGKIINTSSDSLVITANNYHKKIELKEDGTFSDTLKVEKGKYHLYDGRRRTAVYLENGYDLGISFDSKKRKSPILFSGMGAEINNYFVKKDSLEKEVITNKAILDLDKTNFEEKYNEINNNFETMLSQLNNVADSTFAVSQKRMFKQQMKFLQMKYDDKQFIKSNLSKGTVAPKFTNYENINGKTSSLNDFKGKYVLVCAWVAKNNISYKMEIPHLKELEKNYRGKKIAFVNISLDKKADYGLWKNAVNDFKLEGIHLFANEDTAFKEAYRIKIMPRFILIDPNGKIVTADAPRPSSNELKPLLDSLKI